MTNFYNYIDKNISDRIGEEEMKDIRKIISDYYYLKVLEYGVFEVDLIKLLFDEDLSLEEISRRTNLSTRQIRRRKDRYIDFFIKIIYRYFGLLENNTSVLIEKNN